MPYDIVYRILRDGPRRSHKDIWSNFMRFASKTAVVDFIRHEPVFGYFDNFGGTRSVRPFTFIGISLSDQNVHYCLDLTHDAEALQKLTDEELGEAVRSKTGSPVRRLKVNGSPFVCQIWDIASADLEPADEDELTRQAQRIQSDEEFVGRLTAAARTMDRTYPESEHVELQIYGTGWPSDGDLAGCRNFHEAPWEKRLDIALGLMDGRFRRLGRRLIYVERPDLLRAADRAALDVEVARRLRGGEGDFPWMTLPRAAAELEELIAGAPQMEQEGLLRLREEMRNLSPSSIDP